jgi:hypothetical protein
MRKKQKKAMTYIVATSRISSQPASDEGRSLADNLSTVFDAEKNRPQLLQLLMVAPHLDQCRPANALIPSLLVPA